MVFHVRSLVHCSKTELSADGAHSRIDVAQTVSQREIRRQHTSRCRPLRLRTERSAIDTNVGFLRDSLFGNLGCREVMAKPYSRTPERLPHFSKVRKDLFVYEKSFRTVR